MPPEVLALIDHPVSLIAVLFVGALFGMIVENFVTQRRRAAWKAKNKWRWEKKGPGAKGAQFQPKRDAIPAKTPDAADQLRIVMDAQFSIQPLLNKSEARLFRELDRMVQSRNPAWQVMAQVSLGEILRCKDSAAYGCVNSKRVDLLLVDGDCQPLAAKRLVEKLVVLGAC